VTRRLRVAVDARSLLRSQPRGEGKTLLRLYQEIARLRPDAEVLFFGDDQTRDYQGTLPPGCRAIGLPTVTHRVDVWEDVLFPAAALVQRCRVMHCASSSAPRFAPLPVLLTVHDLIPLVFDDGHSPGERERFRLRLARALRAASAIVTVSESTKRDLQRCFADLRTPVHVARWGCDLPAPPSDAIRQPPMLLAFGGEARRKNTDYVLDRFESAAAAVPGLRLTLVGITSARQRQRVIHRLEVVGLTDQVDLPGFVSEDELAEMWQRACALLYPSLYEGFGMPVVEAIAQGVPVIASDHSSLPEVLCGARGTFPLDAPRRVEHATVCLATDAEARRAMVLEQQAATRTLDWAETARIHLSLLQSL
jgi:glycosyltransferase involved in cell wall biosynthesis